MLIEKYQGRFPFWLAPEQVRILTINHQVLDYSKQLETRLRQDGIRVQIDSGNKTLQKRILTAHKEMIPLIVIIGKKEKENKTVSARNLEKQHFSDIPIDQFVRRCIELNDRKSIKTII